MAITITATTVSAGETALATQYNDVVTDLNTIVSALDTGGYGVPVGAILPWWSPNSGFALPTGFQVCDGTAIESGVYAGNNTPDLTSKFLMGTTHAAIGTISGGTNTHNLAHTHSTDISHSHSTHTHTTAAHTLIASEMPTHSHGLPATVVGQDIGRLWTGVAFGTNFNIYDTLTSATTNTGGGGSHSHGNTGSATISLSTTSKTSTSTLSSTYDIRPAYIGVVYIIRTV